jgi:hypothetical protein
MIRSIEGFPFATELDVNMVYFHITLNDYAQNPFTVVIPWNWGSTNTTLTHGYQDCLVPDVFQNVMSKLVQDMEYVKTDMSS